MDKKRRRWPKVVAAVVLIVAALFYGGGGYMFSNMIMSDALTPKPATPDYGVYAVSIDNGTITLASDEPRQDIVHPGTFGLAWDDGSYGVLGEVISVNGPRVVRKFTPVTEGAMHTCAGSLAACDPVDIEGWAFQSDPTDVGLRFFETSYISDLGEIGAWEVPAGDGAVWAIHARGWRASRRETLRSLSAFHEAGVTSLVIDMRNDVGAPPDPSGIYRFGLTEWKDVEGAVRYAIDHGAEKIVLVGYSTGASAHMSFLTNSPMADRVDAVVFDSPNIDMGETIRHGAKDRTIPGTPVPVPDSLTNAAMLIADLRWDIAWNEIDYSASAAETLSVPTLVFHGDEDTRVPIASSHRLANDVSSVELVVVEGAGHVTSWNIDPEAYETHLWTFLLTSLDT